MEELIQNYGMLFTIIATVLFFIFLILCLINENVGLLLFGVAALILIFGHDSLKNIPEKWAFLGTSPIIGAVVGSAIKGLYVIISPSSK